MGNYVTTTDMKEHYQLSDLVRLTRPDGSTESTVDDDLLDRVITQAEGTVNGYLRTRYKLPFITVPQIVKRIARFLTYYYLMEIKFAVNQQLLTTYENIMTLLKDLQAGRFVLDTDPDDTQFESRKVQDSIQIKNAKETFSDDNLSGFI